MKKTFIAASLFLLILTIGCTKESANDTGIEQQKTVTGKVVADIDEPTDISADYDICENAEIYGLCNKLDTSFRKGYKKECCNAHGLCC